MLLRKETPGNLVICPAAPWTVKYLHSRGQVTSILLLVWCLLPWAKNSCAPREKLQRHASYQLHSSTPDLESAVWIPTPLHLDATKARETPCTAAWEAEMPYSPLVLRAAQRGSCTRAARIPNPEHKTHSNIGRNNFRPAGGQGGLHQWLPLPTMHRQKCFTRKSRWEQCFPPTSTATVLE